MLNFGNLSLLGSYPSFGMHPMSPMQYRPLQYPGTFHPMPVWGGQAPIQGPYGMPVQGTMQRYPLASSMMPGRLDLGSLGRSGMMRSPQAY